jgi:acyl-CoA thioester hydrolase
MDIDIGNSAKSRKNVGMVTCTVENHVRFAETDAMGVTHHANYLSWFEMSRVALLDKLGCPYRELESAGFLLPVLEAGMTFHRPTRFDDRVRITVNLATRPSARLRLTYEVHTGETLVMEGFTEHAFVNREFKPVRPPENFMSVVDKHFSK